MVVITGVMLVLLEHFTVVSRLKRILRFDFSMVLYRYWKQDVFIAKLS